jgi:preprotein translocase subunit SecY
MAVFSGFSNITKIPDLRRRFIFSLVVLAIYRVGVFITMPGVDRTAMAAAVQDAGGLVGIFNMFSGGALANMSVFALGIMPYISSSIIMQLMGLVSKRVEELRKEGEAGRRKLEQWTRYGTIFLAIVQAYAISTGVENVQGGAGATEIVAEPGWGFRLMAILSLTTGTALLMWMGEQATERGIGNGTSLIIFASIVSGAPAAVGNYLAANAGQIQPLAIMIVVGVVLVCIATVVFFERAQRRIPIQYARRKVGRRVYGGDRSHLPLKVNMASMIPPIFASSLLAFPATLGSFFPMLQSFSATLNRGDWVFNTLFGGLIIFFCFFYTAVTFQPVDVADNLKKQQANIPGIRPGRQTAEYIDRVVSRVTVGGALYVVALCVVPNVIAQVFRMPFQFGGTSLMIVVGVALETVNQIEAHLIQRSYEGVTGPATTKLSGRRPA